MEALAWAAFLVAWFAWCYPFVFRAPHNQKRGSITVALPTRIGLLLESSGIILAVSVRIAMPPGWARLIPAVILAFLAIWMAWSAVRHLGKQFRVHAGLYEDHELITTGAYSIVRHPIYASLLGMLLMTILILTPWTWALPALVLFVVGTEVRVRTEDKLLESRFGDEFRKYRSRVRAYIPWVR